MQARIRADCAADTPRSTGDRIVVENTPLAEIVHWLRRCVELENQGVAERLTTSVRKLDAL